MKRKTKITLEEVVDDIIYFSLSAVFAMVLTFIFDIHWSFYQEGGLFPLKFIFKSKKVYLVSAFCGGILGLVWIKTLIFAYEEGTLRKIIRFFRRLGKSHRRR